MFDTDWQSKAYETVSGQNSNNSVRVTDAFMRALDDNADWQLIRRTDGGVAKTIKARGLWDKIARAAWESADPGLQFHTTINNWHTCLEMVRGSDDRCPRVAVRRPFAGHPPKCPKTCLIDGKADTLIDGPQDGHTEPASWR